MGDELKHELKSCPWCKYPPVLTNIIKDGTWYAECFDSECERHLRTVPLRTKASAIEAWNLMVEEQAAYDGLEPDPNTPGLKPCNYCEDGGEPRIVSDGFFHVVGCSECGYTTGAYCTKESAIAAWNARADDVGELPSDDACAILRKNLHDVGDLGRAMGILEPNELVGGSGDRAYIFECLADLIERDYVRRDSIGDDAPKRTCELEETERFVIRYDNKGIRPEVLHVLECSECGRTSEHVFGNYERCPHCGSVNVLDENYEPQVIENAENYNLADDSRPQVVEIGGKHKSADEPDSRERLESDVYDGFSDVALSEQMRDVLRSRVHAWLDRQAEITSNETSHDNPYVGLVRGKRWKRTEISDYYCGKCGWKVTDHDSYCPECGSALHKASNKPNSQFDALKTAETAENVTSKNEIHNFDDSRERLEADAKTLLFEFGGYCANSREGHTDNVDTFFDDFIGLLDRQAAITRAEIFADGEYDCTTCGAKAELCEQVDILTAEVDQLTNAINELQEKQPYCYNQEQPLDTLNTIGRYIDELTAERDDLQRITKELEERNGGLLEGRAHWIDQAVSIYRRFYPHNEYAVPADVSSMVLAKIDELTAERDEWKTKCETREVAYKQADAERKRYSEQIDELFAERDYWKDQVHKCAIEAVKPGGYTAGIMRYPRTDGYCEPSLIVTDAIVSLKDFYADEKRVNDKLTAERDELRDKLDEKQHVCDVQRESFRKMEKLLADAKAADYTAMRDEAERLSAENARLKAENRELCLGVYGAPF